MVVLEASYEISDDGPAVIRSAGELDALLDRMVADGLAQDQVPPLVELFHDGDGGWALAYVGVNIKRGTGFITHSNSAGTVTSCDGGEDRGLVEYSYMGHLREISANAEVPLDDVREAANEFYASGGAQPSCVTWRVEQPGATR